MTDRLFDIEDIPEVPVFREPRGVGARRPGDARFKNDYPPSWHRCETCRGGGRVEAPLPDPLPEGGVMLDALARYRVTCPDCLGMGSLKGRARLEAEHRCIRCGHPYMPKGDARRLGVEPSGGRWSACDERCDHDGPIRVIFKDGGPDGEPVIVERPEAWLPGQNVERVEAAWRILTVHHLDGDKANVCWWNLAALCQRCHLEIQAKVQMERVYPHLHSEWFRPFVAGYYAWVYLGEHLTRDEITDRMDDLLALELAPA